MKTYLMFVFMLVSGMADAEEHRLKTVPAYCSVVEARIVNLAEAEVAANSELSKYAADQPTSDAKKFQEARSRLQSISASLKDNEEEWERLGCIHIYPK
jgi:hypothetical protein